jgi:hypothetical protein
MKTRILIAGLFVLGLVITIATQLNSNESKQTPVAKATGAKPEQFIVLLDLSDRIIQPGQIETDKQVIEKVFEEFEKKAKSHLIMNSKDRFQICIAPQKNLPFDRDIESENMTFDFAKIKVAERVKKLDEFRASLRSKLDELYTKAYMGNESKNYQGSNIWQFFNENLPPMTSKKNSTRLVVITDGYFDFEEGNAKLVHGNKSTTTNFISQIRNNDNWKEKIEKEDLGILPISGQLSNVSVCVAGIRSKNPNNLNEVEMLSFIWAKWLSSIGFSKEDFKTIQYNSISIIHNQIVEFLSRA